MGNVFFLIIGARSQWWFCRVRFVWKLDSISSVIVSFSGTLQLVQLFSDDEAALQEEGCRVAGEGPARQGLEK